MSRLTLSPAELHELGCTPDEGEELLSRRARRLRRAMLDELEADLPKLRAKANLQREAQGRSLNGVRYGASLEHATPTPSDSSDVAVLVAGGIGHRLSPELAVPRGLVLSYITREQFEALAPASGFGEPGWERRLVLCQDVLPDLRATIKAGFNDPIHDAFKGRPRFDWEGAENDPAHIDAFASAIIESTTDRGLLEGWLEAAADQQHAILIRARVDKLFGHKDPDFWGPKDDKLRAASPIGHAVVGARG